MAFAADILALAICEIGAIAQRRIALLVDPALSFGLPAFLAAEPGLNSGLMIAEVTSAALMSENKQLAHPASVELDPHLGQPGGPCLHGLPRRTPPRADGARTSRRSSASRRCRRPRHRVPRAARHQPGAARR